MLFNSLAFCLLFLPLALSGYLRLSRRAPRAAIVFLGLASLVFYGYGDSAFLPLLLLSIGVNFTLLRRIARHQGAGRAIAAKRWLVAGLVFNLALLVFFKYADFLLANVASLAGVEHHRLGLALPIGISFFTFTQIACLVDCHAGKVQPYRPENYALFVTYFPHLIAGPILHHKDMMPQFEQAAAQVFRRGRLVVGLAFFTLGLFKKVVLADGVARFVAPVFDLHYQHLSMLEAWAGVLAYTFQLYFDFSAYCDMAYGLSYLFGIILPVNFDSPYQAASIIDFWRRWHITLSHFLRDYLYIPLGGNRDGAWRRHGNLLATMLLGGLWHGANWTFIAWGALHGAYLVINHALRRVPGRRGKLVHGAGAVVTFVAVVLAWVFFRAASIDVALAVLRAMAGGTLTPLMRGAAMGRIMPLGACLAWLAGCALIAFCAPNAYRWLGRGIRDQLERRWDGARGGCLLGAMLVACLLLLVIGATRGVSEFLYFNF